MPKVDLGKILELESKATKEEWEVESFYNHVYRRPVFNCYVVQDGKRWKVPDFNPNDAWLCKILRNNIVAICEELKSSRDKIAKLVSEINTMLKEEEIYGEANTLKLAKLVEQIETEQFLDTALQGWEVFK